MSVVGGGEVGIATRQSNVKQWYLETDGSQKAKRDSKLHSRMTDSDHGASQRRKRVSI